MNAKFLAQGMQGTQFQHAQTGQKTAISNHSAQEQTKKDKLTSFKRPKQEKI